MQTVVGLNENEGQSRLPTRLFTMVTIDCLQCSALCVYNRFLSVKSTLLGAFKLKLLWKLVKTLLFHVCPLVQVLF